MTENGKAERSSVYEAVSVLTSAGYHAERVSGHPKIFNIIAWRGSRTLCIAVRSSRQARLSAFRDYVTALSRMITAGSVPGEVQFWIYRFPGWNYWRITAGGATPIEQWDHSPGSSEVAAV